jgi:ribonuclease P protein subunit POP4
MDYNNKNIVLHELIGLRVRVLSSLDKKQRGLSGIVVDETKNTLVVETRSGVKRIVKNISQFRFYFGKQSFKVDGKEINFRPVERTGKAFRFYRRRENKE